MAGITLHNRGHTQLCFAFDDFLAQFKSAFNVFNIRQGQIAVQIVGQLPTPGTGAGKELHRALFAVFKIPQGMVPDRFAADNGKRHVDAVHRHKVNFVFPALPVPPAG